MLLLCARQYIPQNELQVVGKIPLGQMGSVVLGAGVHVEINPDTVFCFLTEIAVLLPEEIVITLSNGLIDSLFCGGNRVD